MVTDAACPPDLTVLERGWLSANNIVLHGLPDEGATLVDTGHSVHAAQTVALVAQALQHRAPPDGPPEMLNRIINTHLHSDHCGGNAALQAAHGAELWIAPGQAQAVADWDLTTLSYGHTGQRCDRYRHDRVLAPGEALQAGRRRWEVLAAPGHDPDSIMLFDAQDGILMTADALWQNGFGVVFPELEGVSAFDDVAEVLDLIERLDARLVIPGHGAPFADIEASLRRARQRLSKFVANPSLHARHAAKVLVKYHVMEERQQALEDLLVWADQTALLTGTMKRAGFGGSPREWCSTLLAELIAVGALRMDGQVVHDM